MFAAIGTDGLRFVVWGLGETEEAAEAEAAAEAGSADPQLACTVPVTAERAADIRAGAITAEDLVSERDAADWRRKHAR